MLRSVNTSRQYRSQGRDKYGPKLLNPGWRGAHDPTSLTKLSLSRAIEALSRRRPRYAQAPFAQTAVIEQHSSYAAKTKHE